MLIKGCDVYSASLGSGIGYEGFMVLYIRMGQRHT